MQVWVGLSGRMGEVVKRVAMAEITVRARIAAVRCFKSARRVPRALGVMQERRPAHVRRVCRV